MRSEHPFSRPFPERGALAASEGPCPGVAPRRRSPGEPGRGRPGSDRVRPGPREPVPISPAGRPRPALKPPPGAVRIAGLFLPKQLRGVGVGVLGIRSPAPKTRSVGSVGEQDPGEEPRERAPAPAHPAIAARGWTGAARPPARPQAAVRGGRACAGQIPSHVKVNIVGETEKGLLPSRERCFGTCFSPASSLKRNRKEA